MHIKTRNVNTAFAHLVQGIASGSIPTTRSPSRVGDVLQIEEVMTITYENPRERVLFNKARDCNPFFHIYESLWMLAGRNDVAPLQYYASGIREIASDDGHTFNGAYGRRWRFSPVAVDERSEGENIDGKGPYKPIKPISRLTFVLTKNALTDQLQLVIDQLKAKPNSRRTVLSMWNVEDDLLKIDSTKDVCCNLCCTFMLRKEDSGLITLKRNSPDPKPIINTVLDMTVFNRSNDMIWGMLGANVVHFSFLQEYIACCLGVEVGVYNQVSSNLHVYTDNNGGFKPDEWLAEQYVDYESLGIKPGRKLVHDQERFDREVQLFIDDYKGEPAKYVYGEPFLQDAHFICSAFRAHKKREYNSALIYLDQVKAQDWKLACTNWIEKRQKNYGARKRNLAVQYGDQMGVNNKPEVGE